MQGRLMARAPKPQTQLIDRILEAMDQMDSLAPSLSKPAKKNTREMLLSLRNHLDRTVSNLDPVREPSSWFDPADPDTAGRLVAAALLAQPRIQLNSMPRTYGAGVYAIYFTGNHPLYAPISGSETPIYVGKADPVSPSARTPREQGERLYGRLSDHRKMIVKVGDFASENNLPNPLKIADFECRRLVTATNAQIFAERHLIDIFRPVWNSETRVC
jgi:hypothetical protein